MTTADALEQGRRAFRERAWADACAQFSTADGDSRLELDDLESWAMAAYLTGHDRERDDLLERAHQESLQAGDVARAARCAFWLGLGLFFRGEFAPGGGWIARARSILEESGLDCVEQGYVLAPEALQSLEQGDPERAHAIFVRMSEIAERFHDRDLMTLGRLGRGQSLVRLGQTSEGSSLLDEAMVAVTANETSAMVSGIVYCAVIEACHEVFDVRRAQEWTAALSRWCEAQPDLVPFRGQCLARRAEIMQLHGEWPDAADEVERARELLSGDPMALGLALYVQGELHRLLGEFSRAEEAYRQASQWGHSPQPGLAQLRLAQGQVEAAAAGIRVAMDEATDRLVRSRLLGAYVDIMLAVPDVASARAAADELVEAARELGAPLLRSAAAQADGATRLAEGDPRGALLELRRAWSGWQRLEAPHDAARVRVLIGCALRALGDEDTAQMEFDAARWVFEQLGAAPALAHVDGLARTTLASTAGGLTARELEVLRLIAAGKTNRAIASELVISEKTVARHVSNILTKLGLQSRAAATAFAYEHALL